MCDIKNEKEHDANDVNEDIESNLDATKEEMNTQEEQDGNDISFELEKCQEEVEEYKNKYLRLNADFQNYRRRTEKEKSDIYQFGSEKIIVDMLTILDNLERAILSIDIKKDGGNNGLIDGIQMVYKQFKDALSKHGVEEIECLGEEFDPNCHHAVIQEDHDEKDSNLVLEVFEKGYKLNTKIIRPSMVKVSK